MIGLDTNIVVRYLTHDDPAQAAKAVRLMSSLSPEDRGFLSLVVIVELVWVLQDRYRFPKDEIVSTLDALLRSKELMVERADVVWQAVQKFRICRSDFADCLIQRSAQAAGCEHTITFDQDAARTAGMKLLN
jgi:predicted nucleic-acid-binding protein